MGTSEGGPWEKPRKGGFPGFHETQSHKECQGVSEGGCLKELFNTLSKKELGRDGIGHSFRMRLFPCPVKLESHRCLRFRAQQELRSIQQPLSSNQRLPSGRKQRQGKTRTCSGFP